jgi:EAL domain-containing protein (putative c-di-GMP-specific phosphodiesterase class I)
VEHGHVRGQRLLGQGVQTDAEAEVLRELGCDYVQGPLVAEPGAAFRERSRTPSSG